MQGGLTFDIDLDLRAVAARTLAARPAAIHAGLEHLGDLSDAQTPRDTGALLQSRAISPEAEIEDTGWLGYYIGYAIFVHEILSAAHPHGNAKFLELAMLAGAEMAKQIAARVIGEAI
jgi:hypothetical protein